MLVDNVLVQLCSGCWSIAATSMTAKVRGSRLSTRRGKALDLEDPPRVISCILFSCSMDSYVIGDLNYETSLYAYVEAHVFKFADRAVLDFQCAINICVKEGGGCTGITVWPRLR